jgi:hypothetical protein
MSVWSAAAQAIVELLGYRQKLLLEITLSGGDLHYCTGQDAMTYDGDVYKPRSMVLKAVRNDEVTSMRWSITIDDKSGALYTSWRDDHDQWDEAVINVHRYGRRPLGAWTALQSWSWRKATCSRDPMTGWFTVTMDGAAGTRPSAGLGVGTLTLFRFAPGPGDTLTVGDGDNHYQVYVGAGAGTDNPPIMGGQNPPYLYRLPHGSRGLEQAIAPGGDMEAISGGGGGTGAVSQNPESAI